MKNASKEGKMASRFTRREFLKGAAMTAVGLAAASCAQPTPQIIEKEVPVERVVKETVVVEKEVAVERVVTPTPVVMKYKEAPMLAGMVQAGRLPPVDERLPEDPLVIEPWEEIGQYGGTWHRLATTGGDTQVNGRLAYENPLRWTKDANEVIPNVCKSWEISPDGKVFTFTLRKGMKWSDGHPFTADDYMFYLNDHNGNSELATTVPSWLRPGGEMYTAEKIDDYTWRISFGAPAGIFLLYLASNHGLSFMQFPKHFCQQYHVDYVAKETLEKMAKDAGFEFWYQLYNNKRSQSGGGNPDCPVIFAWKVTVPAPKMPVVAERNPYYWKVDTAGNQLPYIDRIEFMLVESAPIINMRAMAGEVDMQLRHMTFDNYPLFMDNREQGDYRILGWSRGYITDSMIQPNIMHLDPVMRQIIGDKRFRWALSLGMNREEIIESVFLGVTEPNQISPTPTSPFYWEEQAKNMLEHDPARANAYLDEMGLTERDSADYRLRPDGKRLTLIFDYAPIFGSWGDIIGLLAVQWKDLGIEVIPSEMSRQLYVERFDGANLQDIHIWTANGEFHLVGECRTYIQFQNKPLNDWRNTGGREGEEPPEHILEQYKYWDEITVTVDTEKQKELMRKILEIHKEHMVTIGICTAPPEVVVVKNNFRNVPDSAVSDWPLLTPGNTIPEQYFIKQS